MNLFITYSYSSMHTLAIMCLGLKILKIVAKGSSINIGLIIFEDIKFVDVQNFALNKNFHRKIFEAIDNPQNYLLHIAST